MRGDRYLGENSVNRREEGTRVGVAIQAYLCLPGDRRLGVRRLRVRCGSLSRSFDAHSRLAEGTLSTLPGLETWRQDRDLGGEPNLTRDCDRYLDPQNPHAAIALG